MTTTIIDLRKFFTLVFDIDVKYKISRLNLQRFVEKHLAALVQNNVGGKYDAMIAATAAAFTDFFGNIEDKHLAVAIQKSKTRVNDLALQQFIDAVDTHYNLIAFKFPKDTPEYLEFFPRGKDEYNKIAKPEALVLMDTMITACTTHVAEITQAVVDEFTAIRTLFSSSRTEQLQKMEVSDAESSEIAATRTALEFQLNKNILTLALEYLGNVDRGMDFFDQQYLGRTGATGAGTTPAPEPTPAPSSIAITTDQSIPSMLNVNITGNSFSTGAQLIITWLAGIFNSAVPANGSLITFQHLYTAAGIYTFNITGALIAIESIGIAGANLTSIVIPSGLHISVLDLFNNKLDSESVNGALMALDANGILNGTIYIPGGTNAAPTGQGIAAKNHLIAKGWTVTTN